MNAMHNELNIEHVLSSLAKLENVIQDEFNSATTWVCPALLDAIMLISMQQKEIYELKTKLKIDEIAHEY